MKARAVIFDFDGVIADTEPLHLVATQQVLEPRRVGLAAAEYADRYLGYNDRDLFAALSRDRGLGWTTAEIEWLIGEKTRAFDAAVAGRLVVYPSAARCIARLSESGLPLAIASGAFADEIEAILIGASLRAPFRSIVGAGDYVNGKPAPDPFLEAARRLNIPPRDCVAIEDSPWGLASARAAGCKTIAVTQTYPREGLKADVVVENLDEIEMFI